MKNMVSWFRKNLLLVMTIGSVVAGAFLGFAIRPLNLSPQTVMLVSFPGELLMRMLKMMILPLIISSLISAAKLVTVGIRKFQICCCGGPLSKPRVIIRRLLSRVLFLHWTVV
ncbi:hypothetical protein NECAME_05518 [Necator americanus]|uniref:Amino acid transporter n=1 Tax=Necator americanus TaxID=51031 RepID=W2SGK0_NECAM|nr:hypothetical protein NECAME_05518 [Necator americanus]ETN68673.1 hypothetical protein NECAME_05518 [Necator americanus]